MKNNIYISDKNDYAQKKRSFIESGVDSIHILSDFDRTLTKAYVEGVSTPSLISLLRDNGYLTDDYSVEAHKLFDHYNSIEKNLAISEEVRRGAMCEWWSKHFELMIQSGLTKKDIKSAIDLDKIKLRSGACELFEFSHKNNIPFVVMSSSGLGEYGFSCFFNKYNINTDSVHIVSNRFNWGEDEEMVSVREPIIYGMSKNEVVLKHFDFYPKIKDRKNVILIGDSLSDIDMITGFSYDNIITVGLLNEDVDEKLKVYKDAFDVVIVNDGEIDFIVDFLKEVIQD